MDKEKTNNNNRTVTKDEALSRRPWTRPNINRIEMKRTMFAVGSANDSSSGHT
jgi:hypothetical protein